MGPSVVGGRIDEADDARRCVDTFSTRRTEDEEKNFSCVEDLRESFFTQNFRPRRGLIPRGSVRLRQAL